MTSTYAYVAFTVGPPHFRPVQSLHKKLCVDALMEGDRECSEVQGVHFPRSRFPIACRTRLLDVLTSTHCTGATELLQRVPTRAI